MSNLLVRDITAEIEAFLENEIGSAFCVPWVYGEKAVAALGAAGFAFRQCKVTINQFVIDALCITFRDAAGCVRLDEAIRSVYGTSRELVLSKLCIGERQFHPLVLPQEANVTVHEVLGNAKNAEEKLVEQAAIAEYRKTLEMLSRISGCWVHFRTKTSGKQLPIPDESGTLHILTNACPPGQAECHYLKTVYGKLINVKGADVIGWGPTAGRGKVLKDENGVPTVQLLGNTWYLLLPTLRNFNTQTSRYIFEMLLGQAWSAHVAGTVVQADEVTAEKFGDLYTSWVDEMPSLLNEDVRNAQERIARLNEDLATTHRTLSEAKRFLTLLANPAADRKRRKRAMEDWDAVAAYPLVKRLTYVDDGLHVETVPIHLPHEGSVYDLGTFTVRVSHRGQISIWNEAIKQYKGYPHPHINEFGHPCFGNASTAITQAAGEMRIADAVRYMLRWLTESYTPELTEIKLETWPRVGESEEAYGKRMGLHQIHDPAIKVLPMTDAEAALWKDAVEIVGTLIKDPKLDAILAESQGPAEASAQPHEQEEKNDTPA